MASAAPAPEEAKPAKRSITALLPIIAAVVIATGASTGVSVMLTQRALAKAQPAAEGHEGEAEEPKPEAKTPPVYVPLDPAFVVNLEGDDSRFLQAQVQLMGRDPKVAEVVKVAEPRIRNALLMLFSQQRAQDIATRQGKEKLQADVLAEVQKIMTDETGKPVVEAVYFTSFVTQ